MNKSKMVYNIETTTMLTGSIQDNEVKVIFNPRIQKLFVGDSLKIVDESGQGIVAQIYKFEIYDSSTEDNKLKSQVDSYLSVADENSLDDLCSINIANCIFKYSIIRNKWVKWRGNLPSLTDYIEVLSPKEIITHTIGSTPLNQALVGNLANANFIPVKIEASFLEGISLISASSNENRYAILSSITSELLQKDAKILFIDFKNKYLNDSDLKIIEAGKDYKLLHKNPKENQNNDWMFVNDQNDRISLANEILDSNQLVLNLNNIPEDYQEHFINQAIDNLIQNRICVFIIFNDIPTYLDPTLCEDMVYINKKYPINFIFCTTGEHELPYPIIKYADNYFLFNSDGFHKDSTNYNNLKADRKLLSQLLKYLPDNGFILYGELTSNYPLLVELDEASYMAPKPMYFGSVKKQISESGEIIYSYKTGESNQKPAPHVPTEPIKEDSYIATYKSISQEYEDEEVDFNDNTEEDDYNYGINDYEEEDNENILDDQLEESDDQDDDEEDVPIIKMKSPSKASTLKQTEYSEEAYQTENISKKSAKTTKASANLEVSAKQPGESIKKQTKSQPKQSPIKNIGPRSEAIPDYIDDIPVYSDPSISEGSSKFQEGNHVLHERYGIGIINRVITTGDKQLCSIQFQDYGRRLLDPNRGLQKIE